MILINYATKSRPNLFVRAMNNIRTTTLTDYKILVSCDEDDRTMNTPQIRKFIDSRHRNTQLFYGPTVSKIDAINRDIEHAGDWSILVNMSDDFVFKVRGWDRLLRQRVSTVWGESTDFFAHFNDGYVGHKLPTMSIIGREYFERDGYVYHPIYKSFSSDAEAMYVAMARGRYHYFKDVLAKHEHPANSRVNRNDSLYKHNSTHSTHDTKNYFERLNNDFYLNIPGPHPWDQFKTI